MKNRNKKQKQKVKEMSVNYIAKIKTINKFINKVIEGDCIEVMKTIPDNSIDLIFADPPFNIGLKYDNYNDKRSYEDYYNWSVCWIRETYRILKKTGTIYIAIGDEFAAEINLILKKQDLISGIG